MDHAMQYFKPGNENQFVGDCMPFFHDGTYHLYYLLDGGHHGALGGLGGHRWAHVSSTDLVHWTHHPMAIPITEDWEGSICTGSTFFHEGTYYGFYATRTRERKQHLSLAVSGDGVSFQKTVPNLASPPEGYSPYHYRDPFAFREEKTGLFHLLVTAQLEGHAVPDRGGCLAHLVSADLETWRVEEPFLIPGYPGSPECPDYFEWNGWYYLVFSSGLTAHYRMSRDPLGPWRRPRQDVLDGHFSRVIKTAPFGADRRIGVAWLGTRQGDTDDGRFQWGGNAVFREIIQFEDGSLGTRFVPEMALHSAETLQPTLTPLTDGASASGSQVELKAPEGLEVAAMSGVTRNARLTTRVRTESGTAVLGFRLRADDQFGSAYDLSITPAERKIALHDASLLAVEGLDSPFTLEIVMTGDIIDVCFDGRHCLINRLPERHGDRILLYCQNGAATFADLEVQSLE